MSAGRVDDAAGHRAGVAAADAPAIRDHAMTVTTRGRELAPGRERRHQRTDGRDPGRGADRSTLAELPAPAIAGGGRCLWRCTSPVWWRCAPGAAPPPTGLGTAPDVLLGTRPTPNTVRALELPLKVRMVLRKGPFEWPIQTVKPA